MRQAKTLDIIFDLKPPGFCQASPCLDLSISIDIHTSWTQSLSSFHSAILHKM